MPFRRGRSQRWYVRVPDEGGGDGRIVALRTTDQEFAEDVEAALRIMKRRRMWRELAAVPHPITFDQVRDAYAKEELSKLADRLDDVDLQTHVAGWVEALTLQYGNAARPGVAAHRTTPEHYRRELRRLMPEGAPFPRSRFTVAVLRAYLAARPGKPATKSRAKAALSSFARHLLAEGALAFNPLRQVPSPKVVTPEPRYLALHESDRLLAHLVDTPAMALQSMVRLAHATGMELMALRLVTRREIDTRRWLVRAPGTKTDTRDRTASIDPWARPALAAFLAAFPASGGAVLFPFLADETAETNARKAFKRALKAAGLRTDYTFHDARHSWAVRYAAAGVPWEAIAQQLGHADSTMTARVYGRFRPAATDVARYQAMATARDGELHADATAGGPDDPTPAVVLSIAPRLGQASATVEQNPLHADENPRQLRTAE